MTEKQECAFDRLMRAKGKECATYLNDYMPCLQNISPYGPAKVGREMLRRGVGRRNVGVVQQLEPSLLLDPLCSRSGGMRKLSLMWQIVPLVAERRWIGKGLAVSS